MRSSNQGLINSDRPAARVVIPCVRTLLIWKAVENAAHSLR